jgi:flavorubredoxin
METRVTEIADGIFQLSTHLAEIDFGVNQYLVAGEEPALFHTGMRGLFPLVSGAVGRVIDVEALRWVAFGHVEADECGAMNDWLAVAPSATVVQGRVGCMVSVGDLADRPPRALADGETLDTGGHRLRWLDTPHVPHAWEAGLLYDEVTRTLFCGDLFSQVGAYPASTDADIVEPAIVGEDAMPSMSLHPSTGRVIRQLSRLDVDALALMHGPVFTGNCREALVALADDADRRITALVPASP